MSWVAVKSFCPGCRTQEGGDKNTVCVCMCQNVRVCFLSTALTSSSASPSAFPSPATLGLDRAKQLFLIMDKMFARPPSD